MPTDSSPTTSEPRPEPTTLGPRGEPHRPFAAGLARLQLRVAALVGRPWFWVLALGLVFVVPLGRALARAVPDPPSLKIALPAFQLTSEQGRPYGLSDLRGRVWVADFVFTSCPTVCPKLTKRMAEVQHRARNLGDAFHLVTFTVDPENDTPERLAAYAARYHANPARWTFLTGKLGDLETTVVKGFKIAMGKQENAPGSGIFEIFHGERLVLVDGQGMIRGYYEATDEGIDALIRDLKLVVNVR